MKQVLDARSVMKEVPPSQAVQEAVTKAIANVGANISPLPWKDRLAFFGKAIRDAVRNLKLGYDSSWSSTLGYGGNVDGAMYLPYEASNRGIHCAYAIHGGNYSGSIDDEANYVVKYTWQAGINQTLQEFRWLRLYKDRILELAL
ncbi:hypothetical protein AAVH_23702 [Aphelenchoides avenae]|nr:hypothetical protein AAVH_23702 [Aphelenchus avenae]